ncbi:ATP-dependent nuclease [Vibrio harveyi]
MIRKITIKNFRSIDSQTIDAKDLTVFVGSNDAGKSNILRALNLFFNNQTDFKVPFSFFSDFNKYAQVGKKKAKEIVISLELKLPESFRRGDYPTTVYWEKAWRVSGLHREKKSFTKVKNGNKYEYPDFPSYSKIPDLLNKIEYSYVPAIKDSVYLADLQGQMYDVLSTIADQDLHSSASRFEEEIQVHFADLISTVSGTLSDASSIKLPRNLRSIFETLEFDNDGIPLRRRGDGIKARHIPIMLLFKAMKMNSIKNYGIVPHIWGFEEPENNVEMSACFNMAEQFVSAAEKKVQILLTSHSPAFYDIDSTENISSTTLCIRRPDKFSEITNADTSELHEEMGFMPFIASQIKEAQEKWAQKVSDLENEKDELKKELAEKADDSEIPRLFVEGDSDRRFLDKAFSVMYPDKRNKYVFSLRKGANSASAAANRAIAWTLVQQHIGKTPTRGMLVLDSDEAGNKAKESFVSAIGKNKEIVKVVSVKASSDTISLLNKGFDIPKDLESLYSEELWILADKKGWLEEVKNMQQRLKPSKVNELINGTFDLTSLSTYESLRVTKQFSDSGKKQVVKYIENLSTERFEELVGKNIQHLIAPIAKHLDFV